MLESFKTRCFTKRLNFTIILLLNFILASNFYRVSERSQRWYFEGVIRLRLTGILEKKF